LWQSGAAEVLLLLLRLLLLQLGVAGVAGGEMICWALLLRAGDGPAAATVAAGMSAYATSCLCQDARII
jgi:hypothetical protein